METNDFLSQLNSLYGQALSFASPAGLGATPTTGTAINTSTPFDISGANSQTIQRGDWFSAMQGSFNNSFAFVNNVFARNEAYQAQHNDRIFNLTENFGQQLIDIQRMAAKRSTKRGLLSKLF